MLPYSSIISQIYLLLQYRGNCIDCSNQQRGMYGTYNSICSLATTTAAIVVLGDWFPAFVFALPFSYALKGI
jgi:hypothetical protein